VIGSASILARRKPFSLADADAHVWSVSQQERETNALTSAPVRQWRIPTRAGELVIRAEAPPAWFEPTLAAMVELLQLEPDWDSYGARRVEPRAIPHGLDLLVNTMWDETPAPLVVPAPRGGFQLEWHTGGMDLEVEVLPDGHLSYYLEDAIQHSEAEHEGDVSSIREHLARALAELTKRA
jgi:hypothetical protein